MLDRSTFRLSEIYTLANYERALTQPLFRNISLRSLVGAVIVTVVTLAPRLPLRLRDGAHVSSALTRKILLIALFLPFFIGQVVRAYGWLIILGNEGLVNDALGLVGLGPFRMLYNYPAVLFGLVQFMLPFAVLMLAPALTGDPGGDGARGGVARRKLASHASSTSSLPMAKPGLIGAGIVVFTLSLTDFAMPAILGGGTNDFIANAIYDQFFRTSRLRPRLDAGAAAGRARARRWSASSSRWSGPARSACAEGAR